MHEHRRGRRCIHSRVFTAEYSRPRTAPPERGVRSEFTLNQGADHTSSHAQRGHSGGSASGRSRARRRARPTHRPCAHGKLIEATLPNEACYPARPLDRTAAARGKPEHAMAARDLRCYCDRLGDITELPNICTARCTLNFTLKCDFHAEFICTGLVPAN